MRTSQNIDAPRDSRSIGQTKRCMFSEALGSKQVSASINGTPSPFISLEMNHQFISQEILGKYPSDTIISRELYDEDEILRHCLNNMDAGFEFPDWEGSTVDKFRSRFSIPGEPVTMAVFPYLINGQTDTASVHEMYYARPLGDLEWSFGKGLTLQFQ